MKVSLIDRTWTDFTLPALTCLLFLLFRQPVVQMRGRQRRNETVGKLRGRQKRWTVGKQRKGENVDKRQEGLVGSDLRPVNATCGSTLN